PSVGPGVTYGSDSATYSVVPYPSDSPSSPPDFGDAASYGAVPSEYPYDASSPNPSSPETAGVQGKAVAHIIVRVPANAELWFNGSKTTSTGIVREFHSPPLTPGTRYSYEVRVRWQEHGHAVNQTQEVEVGAGSKIQVTFPVRSKLDG